MKKAVMISIQPKWVEKILNGEKTIEVRKTKPNLETPFKCYIYKTKGQYITYKKGALTKYGYGRGKVIGEFTCDRIEKYQFTKPYDYWVYNISDCSFEQTALTFFSELEDYGKGKPLYGLHISDLKIYDQPKEIWEFKNLKGEPIKRPFQSWGYVEE